MKSGLTILEVVVSLAIFSLLIAGIFPTIGWLITRSKKLQYSHQAAILLAEGLEVAYNVFLGDWAAFGPGIYHPALKSSQGSWQWTLKPGVTQAQAKFDHQIQVESVCRQNGTGQLVNPTSGCTAPGTAPDPNSYWLTASVNWTEAAGPQVLKAKLLITKL